MRDIYRYWAKGSIAGHRKMGYEINIDIDFLSDLAAHTKYCFYCDWELEWDELIYDAEKRTYYKNEKGKYTNKNPTVDRLNNEKCLNKDNIVICCKQCNSSKRQMTFHEFIRYCGRIAGLMDQREALPYGLSRASNPLQ